LIQAIAFPLGLVMHACYDLLKNYGFAIILFTIITKIILLPIGIWVHTNSIKIVKMAPQLNRIKIAFFGDRDTIAEEQSKLYKEARYNPLSSLIPLFVQIVLLMGLVHTIYRPMTYILDMHKEEMEAFVHLTAQLTGVDSQIASIQLNVIRAAQSMQWGSAFEALNMGEALGKIIRSLNFNFLGLDISLVPAEVGGLMLIVPLIAAVSSWFLCHVQNRSNVLQSEQGNLNKYGTMALSVGLSLYLGAFVPAGVAVYWVASNLLGVLQLALLNALINPKKHVDFQALEETKKELETLSHLGEATLSKEDRKREKEDYKRFFSIANKHLVFYSESNGFYKYFRKTIEYLLTHSNVTIHYITSDPKDSIFNFAKENSKIKAYYIGEKKLITLMMKLEADIVVMTMSDLNNYHLKRSYVQKDIEYVYMFHYPLSTHMVLHTGALDHYDTIMCVGDFQFAEIKKQEEIYHLPAKKLIASGYGQLELLQESHDKTPPSPRERPTVLIAPSWQQDNLLDTCIHDMLQSLLKENADIVVRPHPEYVKRYKPRMDALIAKYADYAGDNLTFELDFTSNASLFDSDVVITDWSGAAYEFALRDQIGIRVPPEDITKIPEDLKRVLSSADEYTKKIADIRDRLIANYGHSGEVTGEYLLQSLREKIEQRKTGKEE